MAKRHTVHLTLGPKGGIGKTLITTLLAQYLLAREGANVLLADTDPATPTFSTFKSLQVAHINIMTGDFNVDKGRFDKLMTHLQNHEGDCAIDNGSSSFLPLLTYMLENDIVEFLNDAGKHVVIHIPIVGGQAMEECIKGLQLLLKNLPAARFVVWENPYFGPVVKDDVAVRDSTFLQRSGERILGVVTLPTGGHDTWGKTIGAMTRNRLTFAEAKGRSDLFEVVEFTRLYKLEKVVRDFLSAFDL